MVAIDLRARAVPNLVQGVSQQAVQLRKDSQCETQFDCVNSVADGCVARPGADIMSIIESRDYVLCGYYEVIRGDEHYLVVVSAGHLDAFNLRTGATCTVTDLDGSLAYLTSVGGNARDNIVFQAIDDFIFVANKTVLPAMSTALSDPRPHEALVFFHAGAYSTTFEIKVTYLTVDYKFTMTTPDNSSPPNADQIATNYMAAVMYKGISGDTSTMPPGATVDVSTHAASTSAGNLITQGFTVELKGNIIRISRPSTDADFAVSTSDGIGDGYLTPIKDTITAFSKLPFGGFVGFRVGISGQAKAADQDYYVHFVEPALGAGYWEECAGPAVHTTLAPSTMPVLLINTGVNAFTLHKPSWATRIAGDEASAKDPSFVGRSILDMFYHQGRLGVLNSGGATWSKVRNPFTYFPDTVQTTLATDRVDLLVSSNAVASVLETAVACGEGIFFWGQAAQFRVSSGADPFKADTAQALETSAFEYDSSAKPRVVGKAIYFVGSDPEVEGDRYSSLTLIPVVDGRMQQEAVLTDHVPEYIPAPIVQITGSAIRHVLFLRSASQPTQLWCYNSLIQGRDILQSAWNTWRFPADGKVVWCSVFRGYLFLLFSRGTENALCRLPLTSNARDQDGGQYLTRLDMRVTEAQCTVAYVPATRTTAITLPYAPTEASVLTDFLVVTREPDVEDPDVGVVRGAIISPVVAVAGNTVQIAGNHVGTLFYAGYRITSERTESNFYLRGTTGYTATDQLTLKSYTVNHSKSIYYRLEVTRDTGRSTSETYEARTSGVVGSMTGEPVARDGVLKADIGSDNDKATVRIVNDSPFPSRWQTGKWDFTAVIRATVMP